MLLKEIEYYENSNAINDPSKRLREQEHKRKYDELKKAKRNRQRRKNEISKFKRKVAFQIIEVAFIVGIITLAVDSRVFMMQSELGKINNNIKLAEEQNEDLRFGLFESGSLSQIETEAQNRLSMTHKTKSTLVNIDLSSNYFDKLDEEDNNKKEKQVSKLDKIKQLFN